MFDQKRIFANPKAQFRTDEMTSFFGQVYQYRDIVFRLLPHRSLTHACCCQISGKSW